MLPSEAEIPPCAAQAFQTGLVRQDIQHFIQGLAGLAHDHGQSENIKVSHAVIVRQARLRTHTQTAPDRLAVLDCGE